MARHKSMATAKWSNLSGNVLSVIAKILNSEVDLLRLRSVCPSWRSSLPLLPSPFPLKLPILPTLFTLHTPAGINDFCTLRPSPYYRLSSAADPSQGWIFRVSDASNPNKIFSLQHPLPSGKPYYPPGTVPNRLNLLDHRISEIHKSYALEFHGDRHQASNLGIRKVLVLVDFVPDCDFVVLAMQIDGALSYWKLGDDDWTPVDTKKRQFHDVILFQGKCYGVDDSVLVCFDSDFNHTVVSSPLDYELTENFLVKCESELFVVSKICLRYMIDQLYRAAYSSSCDDDDDDDDDGGGGGDDDDEEEDNDDVVDDEEEDDDENATKAYFSLVVNRFDRSSGDWDIDVDLDEMFFVLCFDANLSFSSKEFRGSEGNRVYLDESSFAEISDQYSEMPGVFHLDSGMAYKLAKARDFGKIFLPGSWINV